MLRNTMKKDLNAFKHLSATHRPSLGMRVKWFLGRFRAIAGETLNRMSGDLVFGWHMFWGKETSTKQLDYDALDEAYRQLPFVKPIVKLSAAMLLANGFNVVSEDERAQEQLNDFWARNWGRLRKGARDGALYGDTILGVVWREETGRPELVIRHPGQVKPQIDELEPEQVKAYKIVVQDSMGRAVTREITRDKVITKRGNKTEETPNPYGLLPLVRVTEDALSHEVYGTGDIDEVLFSMLEMYWDLLQRAFDWEGYHGNPVPYAVGVDASSLENQELDPSKWMGSTNKEAKFGFMESSRGTETSQGLLKMFYHGVIGQSRTPEYLLGVHMNSAYASTKEQRAPIEMKTEERRDYWTDGLQEVNRVVLTMLGVHNGMSFQTLDTAIEWGAIFEKDKKEEAETDKMKSEALANQIEMGITSRKTAIEELHEDAESELEQIEKEEEESRKDEGQSK